MIAAIDCGTNTIKLLIGSVADGVLDVAVRESRMVRLGQGVDRTGRLGDEALARTWEAIEEYARLIGDHGVERVRFCATSATRDAENAADFVAGVEARLSVRPEVLTGADEAALAFDGAVRSLRHAPEGEVLVVDIGGGSTELILGTAAGGPSAADSMDVGSVRLHERHGLGDPPTSGEVAAVVADIEAALDACPVDPAAASSVIGVAGTVTTVAAAVLDLDRYDREQIDQQVLHVDQVQRQVERLVAMSVADRIALPWMHSGRADVIGVGALIWGRVLARSGAQTVLVSESDILEGIAWSVAESVAESQA